MRVSIRIPDWARHIFSDHTDMERNPQRVDAAKVSSFAFTLPGDAYFEYAFVDEAGKVRPDPENDLRADNPWYPSASAILGPDYRPDPHAGLEGEPRGTSRRLRLESRVLGQTRRLITYTPADHEGEPLPCLYLQDGVAYYRIARLPLVLEALLAEGGVRPAHLVFAEPGDRFEEYSFNPDYRRSFIEELLPFVESELEPTGERVLMGASLGALASATLAWQRPDLFGTVIAQSGAFLGSPEAPRHYRTEVSWLLERVRAEDPKPLRWSLECGTLEWLLEVNRNLAAALEEKGYDCRYQERNAGHNWVNWRNGASRALRFALAR
ncbi:esterase family protein [soil metagenome]